jgi:hypothetical protein
MLIWQVDLEVLLLKAWLEGLSLLELMSQLHLEVRVKVWPELMNLI